MKRIFIMTLLLFISGALTAQILHPVKWAYAAKMTGKNEAALLIKATIEEPWHIYSINQKEGGPVKTSFTFIPSADYKLDGAMSEPTPVTKYEKAFEMDVHYFEKSVVFQQKVKLKGANPVIKGTLNFMTCNDQKCLPPEDVEFSIPVK
jgi:hypothetical protein